MFLDIFPITMRQNRHFEAPFLTESFREETAEDLVESDDEEVKADKVKIKEPKSIYFKNWIPTKKALEYADITFKSKLKIDKLLEKLGQV